MSNPFDRNPTIIPSYTKDEERPVRRGCPVCKKVDYSGRIHFGVATFTCRVCKNEWQGGLPQIPDDPRNPLPPANPLDRPTVEFYTNPKDTGQVVEVNRPISAVPDFKKGTPIKD